MLSRLATDLDAAAPRRITPYPRIGQPGNRALTQHIGNQFADCFWLGRAVVGKSGTCLVCVSGLSFRKSDAPRAAPGLEKQQLIKDIRLAMNQVLTITSREMRGVITGDFAATTSHSKAN